MKSTSKSRVIVGTTVVAVMVALFLPASGLADTLDFAITAPDTGSISYAGGSAPLIGSDLTVTSVTDLNTGQMFTIIGGLFSFTTGASNGTWSWGANSSSTAVTLTAQCVDTNKDGDTTCDAQDLGGTSGPITLLNGSLLGAKVSPGFISGFQVAITGFNDVKNAGLLSAFGVGGVNAWNGSSNTSFTTSATAGNAFTASGSTQVLSGDIANQQLPEPASLSLLGLGLLGAGLFGRKRWGRKDRKES